MKTFTLIALICLILIASTQQKWGGWKKIGDAMKDSAKDPLKDELNRQVGKLFGDSDIAAVEKIEILKDVFELYKDLEVETN